MTEIQELEQRLAAAKQKKTDEQRDAFLAPFLAVAGKCFLFRDPSKRCNIVGFVKYGKKVEFKQLEGRGQYAQLSEDRVFAQSVPAYWYVGNIVQAKKDTSAAHTSIHDMTRWHIKEVPEAVFKAAWDSAGAIAQMMMGKWESDTDTPTLPDTASVPSGDLDVPHIILEGMEPSIVGQSCFLIGSRFMVTPNSRALVAARIAEEQALDARCSHLYEACDMTYINNKRAATAAVQCKLGSVK